MSLLVARPLPLRVCTKRGLPVSPSRKRVLFLRACMPNIPDPDLLPGEKENNKVIKIVGEQPKFDFPLKNHVDICTDLGMIDYERGVKLSGNGFWIYRGVGARLEWALLNYFVDEHLKDGYEFILPPYQLGYNCGFGAGQFPKFSDEVYWLDCDEDRKRNRFMQLCSQVCRGRR